MRACVQRVREAQVAVGNEVVGQIKQGLLVLLGVSRNDQSSDAQKMAEKIIGLRVFDDDQGQMNQALGEVGGALLVVSQFTLYGDCRKGRRPSYIEAAPPELAERLYHEMVDHAAALGAPVETGRFRTQMEVSLVNDGPVTLLLDSTRLF